MSEADSEVTEAAPAPKPKRVMTEAQKAALQKGREAAERKRREKAAERARESAAADARQQRLASFDDVVARHAEESPDNELQDESDEGDDDDDVPSLEQAARQTQLYVGDDVIPPSEYNPELRDGMTVQVEDHAGERRPQTLEDLFALAPVGDGQYFITVDRRAPKNWGGVPCAGTQQSIREFMTREQFQEYYGGGVYKLTLYGPPPRGALIDPNTGRPRVKALSPTVEVTVPLGLYNPNLQAFDEGSGYDESEDAVRYQPSFGRPNGGTRPHTNADAQMFKAQLEHESLQQQRAEQRERELRAKLDSVPQQYQPLFDMLDKQHEQSVAALLRESDAKDKRWRELLDRERTDRERAELAAEQRARAEAARPSETTALGEALSNIIGALKPEGGASNQELSRITDAAAKDREALMQQQQRELTRVTEQHERRSRDAEERAERRVKEADERAESRIQEATARAERRVAEAKEDAKRQVEDLRQHMTARLEDERRQHDRDLQVKTEMFEARIENQRAMYENRITTIGDELTRVRAEAERFRKDAEDAKDLPTQISKFAATAEAVGYTKADGSDAEPKDWKDMLGRMGLDLIQNLPQIVESAGATVQSLRARGAPAQAPPQQYYPSYAPPEVRAVPPLRGREGEIFQASQQPLAFGSEDGPEFQGDAAPRPPRYPRPEAAINAPPLGSELDPQYAPAPQQRPVPQQQQQQPPPPPQQQVQQVQQAPQQRAPGPSAPLLQISDEQIRQFVPAIEQAFTSKADPDDVAEELVEKLGPQLAAQLTMSTSPQMIVSAIQRQPNGLRSPLVRRDGQKFLAELWAAVAAAAEGDDEEES